MNIPPWRLPVYEAAKVNILTFHFHYQSEYKITWIFVPRESSSSQNEHMQFAIQKRKPRKKKKVEQTLLPGGKVAKLVLVSFSQRMIIFCYVYVGRLYFYRLRRKKTMQCNGWYSYRKEHTAQVWKIVNKLQCRKSKLTFSNIHGKKEKTQLSEKLEAKMLVTRAPDVPI